MIYLVKNARILIYKNNEYSIEKVNFFVSNSKVILKSNSFDKTIDLKGKILIPCFFNLHCHLGESLYKVKNKNLTLVQYLQKTENINNKLTKQKQKKLWDKSAIFTYKKLKKEATIGFCAGRASYLKTDKLTFKLSGYPLMKTEKLEDYLNDFIKKYKDYYLLNRTSNCKIGLFIHSLYMTDENVFKMASQIDNSLIDFITIHISEDVLTRKKEEELYGKEPLKILEKYNLLSSKTIIIHGGLLTNSELEKLKEKECTICICPISNTVLSEETMNVYRLESMDINWTIGSDGYITGKSFSLLKQCKHLKNKFPHLNDDTLFKAITMRPSKFFNQDLYNGTNFNNCVACFTLVNYKGDSASKLFSLLFEGRKKCKIINLTEN